LTTIGAIEMVLFGYDTEELEEAKQDFEDAAKRLGQIIEVFDKRNQDYYETEQRFSKWLKEHNLTNKDGAELLTILTCGK
jgi:hypothetical protein